MAPLNGHAVNRLLGYPDDARLLIINADDFGMCHAINAATLRALREGIATSTTLLVPCPWASHALRLLAEHPEIPFGVHLTLISEYSDYRFGPVTSRETVPSLIDEAGNFHREARQRENLAHVPLDEVAAEFRAQIETVLATGLRPTHLDWHCLADGGRPDIFTLTLQLAQEYGLALRTHEPASVEQARRAGLPTTDHQVLDSYTLGAVDKAARYARLLRALPAGLSEWAVHPSLGDAEARAMEPGSWQVRKADFDFLISPQARQILTDENIILTSYRAIQQLLQH
jgi:chitin disaccharide deacetylase